LANGRIEACFARPSTEASSDRQELPFHAAPGLGRHYRNLARRRTIELAATQPSASRVFVFADGSECESPKELFQELNELRDAIPVECELGVFVSLPDAVDLSAISNVCSEARQSEILLGFVDFQGSSAQVFELESFAPDYLLLSDKMLKGVAAGGQPLRRLELTLTACQQLCVAPVLPQCDCHRTVELCQQLGYEFAVQSQVPQIHIPRPQQFAAGVNS
jgi:hypothetical protein